MKTKLSLLIIVLVAWSLNYGQNCNNAYLSVSQQTHGMNGDSVTVTANVYGMNNPTFVWHQNGSVINTGLSNTFITNQNRFNSVNDYCVKATNIFFDSINNKWDTCIKILCDTVYPEINAPCWYANANFNYQANGNNITFINNSSGDTNVYKWNFGDGNTSIQKNPTHTYTSSGSYNITLTTGYYSNYYQSYFYCDSITQTITIPPVVSTPCDFTPNFSFNQSGNSISFTDASTNVPAGAKYFWNFGDGNTSNQQNPSHQYTTAGNYNVCLYITVNDSNCNPVCVKHECKNVNFGSTNPIQASCDSNVTVTKNYVDNLDGTYTMTYQITGLSGLGYGTYWNNSWDYGVINTFNVPNTGGPVNSKYINSDTTFSVTANYNQEIYFWLPILLLDSANNYDDTCNISFIDRHIGNTNPIQPSCDSNVTVTKNYVDNLDGTYTMTYQITGLSGLGYGTYWNNSWDYGVINTFNVPNTGGPVNSKYINSDTTFSVTANYNQEIYFWLPILLLDSANNYDDTCNISFIDRHIGSSSINQINSINNINIYPNPAQNNITIDFESDNQIDAEIIIRDMIGKVVAIESLDVNSNSKTSKNINISDLNTGGYFVTINDKNDNSQLITPERFVKQ